MYTIVTYFYFKMSKINFEVNNIHSLLLKKTKSCFVLLDTFVLKR